MPHPNFTRISLVTLAVALFCCPAAFSQQPSCAIRTLPISIRDAQNLPIQNISVADLEAKLHGKPIKLLSLKPDPRPHRLVLILDTSGSMAGTNGQTSPWEWELSLADHFFDVNRQKSEIALVFFSDGVHDMVEFSQGNALAAAKLQQISKGHDSTKDNVKGKTALFDAIVRGLQLLDHPTSADALYVLTDAGDNASTHTASYTSQRLVASSVRLFAVLFDNQDARLRSRTIQEADGPQDLFEIAQKSGGEILATLEWQGAQVGVIGSSGAKTPEAFARLYQTIIQDSLLEVELPFPPKKNERWELKLPSAAREKWKGAKITYPTTLRSCDAEAASSSRR